MLSDIKIKNMKKQSIFLILSIALLSTGILINSCRKPQDMFPEPKHLSDSLGITGTIAAPLVDTEFSLFNFVPKGDSSLWISLDDQDLIHIRMYYRELISVKMNQIYSNLVYPLSSGELIPQDSLFIETDTSKMKLYDKMLTGHLFFDDPRILLLCFCNSVGSECFPYKEEVIGSNPIRSTYTGIV